MCSSSPSKSSYLHPGFILFEIHVQVRDKCDSQSGCNRNEGLTMTSLQLTSVNEPSMNSPPTGPLNFYHIGPTITVMAENGQAISQMVPELCL